jgi:hypothetical protein
MLFGLYYWVNPNVFHRSRPMFQRRPYYMRPIQPLQHLNRFYNENRNLIKKINFNKLPIQYNQYAHQLNKSNTVAQHT